MKELDCIGREEYAQASRLFDEMNRLRLVWGKMRPAGLRRSEMGTLGAVAHFSREGKTPATISLLAKTLRQSVPGVSQKVSELEKQGYLTRTTDKNDRRVVTVELTQQGDLVAKGAMRDFFSRVEQALGELGSEKTDELLKLMSQLSASLEAQQKTDEGGNAPC